MSTTAITPDSALILSGEGYSLEIAEDAASRKDELIAAASTVTEVTDKASSELALSQIRDLAAMRNLVEKSRKEIKAPVLEVGKTIDAKAKEFVATIEEHEKRLKKLSGDYAAKVLQAQQEEARKRREAEEQRIKAEREAAEKVRLAEEAAAKAKAEQEAAEKAKEAAFWEDDEAETKKAEEAEAKAKALAEEQRLAAEKLAEEQRIAAEKSAAEERARALQVVEEPSSKVKMVPDFTVDDADLVYVTLPHLCKVEVKRKETLQLITDYMDRNNGELPTITGLTITKTAKVATR